MHFLCVESKQVHAKMKGKKFIQVIGSVTIEEW